MSRGQRTPAPRADAVTSRRRIVAAVAALVLVLVVVGGFILISMPGNNDRSPAAVATSGTASSGPEPQADDDGPSSNPPTPGPTQTVQPGTGGADASAPGEPVPPIAPDAGLAAQELPVAEPVAITGGASSSDGVSIEVTQMEAVDGEALGIGEIAGPAVRFTVSVTNGGNGTLDLGGVVVTVEAGDEALPCTELSGPNAIPFPASVDAGQTATGSFVFRIPAEDRNNVSVFLSYSVDAPVAAFAGAVPTP